MRLRTRLDHVRHIRQTARQAARQAARLCRLHTPLTGVALVLGITLSAVPSGPALSAPGFAPGTESVAMPKPRPAPAHGRVTISTRSLPPELEHLLLRAHRATQPSLAPKTSFPLRPRPDGLAGAARHPLDIASMPAVWYGSEKPHPSFVTGLIAQATDLIPNPPRTLDGASGLACLAVTLYHEARDQPLVGRRAVAAVVLRRASEARRWGGETICDAVRPIQFSYLRSDSSFAPIVERHAWFEAISLAIETLSQGPLAYFAEADHYHTTEVHPSRAEGMTLVATIADHVFYREKRRRN